MTDTRHIKCCIIVIIINTFGSLFYCLSTNSLILITQMSILHTDHSGKLSLAIPVGMVGTVSVSENVCFRISQCTCAQLSILSRLMHSTWHSFTVCNCCHVLMPCVIFVTVQISLYSEPNGNVFTAIHRKRLIIWYWMNFILWLFYCV